MSRQIMWEILSVAQMLAAETPGSRAQNEILMFVALDPVP